jgi:hypothetical protein
LALEGRLQLEASGGLLLMHCRRVVFFLEEHIVVLPIGRKDGLDIERETSFTASYQNQCYRQYLLRMKDIEIISHGFVFQPNQSNLEFLSLARSSSNIVTFLS